MNFLGLKMDEPISLESVFMWFLRQGKKIEYKEKPTSQMWKWLLTFIGAIYDLELLLN